MIGKKTNKPKTFFGPQILTHLLYRSIFRQHKMTQEKKSIYFFLTIKTTPRIKLGTKYSSF